MALTEIPIELSSTPGIVDNSNATAITIDSSENVGIGTASLNAANKLEVTGDINTTWASGASRFIGMRYGDGSVYEMGLVAKETPELQVYAKHGSGAPITFLTGATPSERMRIDSSGNVGIGTTPSELLHVHEASTGAARMRLSNTEGYLEIGTNNQVMNLDSQTHTFRNEAGSSEYMRIDASGNLYIGKSVDTYNTEGAFFEKGAALELTTDDGRVLRLNRTSTDGNILEFNKGSGSVVGSIGTNSGFPYIAAPANFSLMLATTDFRPRTVNGASDNDAAVDLGVSTARFRNLYLSGGVQLGGNGGANKLDDYEEGTWTPVINFGGASVGVTYVLQQGSYTKVGNLVTASCYFLLSSKGTSTGNATVAGLPFTSANVTNQNFVGSMYSSAITFADFLQPFVGVNVSTVSLREVTNGGVQTHLTANNFASNSSMMLSVSYRV